MDAEVSERIDNLTKQIDAAEARMTEIEHEIDEKFRERVELFKTQSRLKRQKLQLLGWDV